MSDFYLFRMCCEILLTDKSPLVRKNGMVSLSPKTEIY